MRFKVYVTKTAENDIDDIIDFISAESSERISGLIFNKIKKAIISLENFPDRGHEPPEFYKRKLGFVEIHSDIYRIFYKIFDDCVYIISVLDGRRNVKEILEKRNRRGKLQV